MPRAPRQLLRVIVDTHEAKLHPMWTETDVLFTDTAGTFIKEGYHPEVQGLPSGDLRLQITSEGPWVVIELKTIPDFIATLRDKGAGRDQSRIRHQVAGLLGVRGMGQIPAMMIIGDYQVDGTGKKIKYGRRTYSASWAEIETAIVAIQHLGIYVMRCPGMEEVPHGSVLLTRAIGSQNHFGDTGLARVGALSPRLDRLATSLTAVSGLGSDRARSIATRFRSFPDFYGASVAQIQEAEGVGKVLATRIWDHFHDETDSPDDPFDPDFDPLG